MAVSHGSAQWCSMFSLPLLSMPKDQDLHRWSQVNIATVKSRHQASIFYLQYLLSLPCFRRNQKGTHVKVFSFSSLGYLFVLPLAPNYQVSSLSPLGKREFKLGKKMSQLSLGSIIVSELICVLLYTPEGFTVLLEWFIFPCHGFILWFKVIMFRPSNPPRFKCISQLNTGYLKIICCFILSLSSFLSLHTQHWEFTVDIPRVREIEGETAERVFWW